MAGWDRNGGFSRLWLASRKDRKGTKNAKKKVQKPLRALVLCALCEKPFRVPPCPKNPPAKLALFIASALTYILDKLWFLLMTLST